MNKTQNATTGNGNNYTWFLRNALSDSGITDKKKEMLIEFWDGFSKFAIDRCKLAYEDRSQSYQFKEEVFHLLKKNKELFPLNDEQLRALQVEIEDLTMEFNEKSIFKSVPNIIKLLIRNNEESAKDFLKKKIDINSDDYQLLTEFGQYTIEALLVYVLGMVFSPLETSSMVRMASLIERVDATVRSQALLLRRGRRNTPLTEEGDEIPKRCKRKETYPFGAALVQFMIDRGLISSIENTGESVPVKKRKGQYYLPKNLYVVCEFDVSLLPIKLNLPMVFPPLDWDLAQSRCDGELNFISDLRGGYLCRPTSSMVDRYRMLSSEDINHFYIRIQNQKKLCSVMNKLQSQAFEINSEWLRYLMDNRDILVDKGLLYPEFLASMNIKDASGLLREYYMKDEKIQNQFSFNRIFDILCKDIQRSRSEQFLIKLADAYDGYKFYLPAFLDFRGRIYRSGVLHFHERDLARSLILIVGDSPDTSSSRYQDILQNMLIATVYHYKSFPSYIDAITWALDNMEDMCNKPYEYACQAKRTFQFLANIIAFRNEDSNVIARTPMTQDASASAYQLMSYFLLDESIARKTNLIPPQGNNTINDIYQYMLCELKEFLPNELDGNLSKVVCDLLTRKIVKGLFMPIIYGKTLMSTAHDLKSHLSDYVTHKECFDIAKACFKFWRKKYQGVDCLIRLLRHIGWLTSARGRPAFYDVPYFLTVQEYMVMETINIWVYDRVHKKRRRVSMKVSSSKRDRRKSAISTFVNFIHQKDAYIAMSVVDKMLQINCPIYTVHDNFITTPECCGVMPYLYAHTIREMGPPLRIINKLIYMNVIYPIRDIPPTRRELEVVIPKETLHKYLTQYKPTNINKRMMETWDERINGILAAYAEYTRIVCDDPHAYTNRSSWSAHEHKWFIFKEKLLDLDREKERQGKEVPLPFYYCLHY